MILLKKYIQEARREDARQEKIRLRNRAELVLGKNVTDPDPFSAENVRLRGQHERIMGALASYTDVASGVDPTQNKDRMNNPRDFGFAYKNTSDDLKRRLEKSGRTKFPNL
jgi:hypothetical protein